MGLALDYHAEDLIPGLTERRRLGPDPDRTKHLPRSGLYLYNGAYHRPDLRRPVPAYKLPLVDFPRREDPALRVDRRRRVHRARVQWTGDDQTEGRDLARSDVPLPSDRTPVRRTPSLERQEAFRDESTSKRSRSRDARADAAPTTAELYRLGLLYDDEHLRGAGFTFDALVRDREPAYTVRPAKRARKLNRGRGYDDFEHPDHDAAAAAAGLALSQHDPGLALALDLSFAELARDDAIARYLISPDPSETSDDDETVDDRLASRTRTPDDILSSGGLRQYSTATGSTPLRVLYELTSSVHSLNDNDNVPDLPGAETADAEDTCARNDAVSELGNDNSNHDDAYDNDYDAQSEYTTAQQDDWAVLFDTCEVDEDCNDGGAQADAATTLTGVGGGGSTGTGAWVMLG